VVVIAVVDGEFLHVGTREFTSATPADPGEHLQGALAVALAAGVGSAAGITDNAVEPGGIDFLHRSTPTLALPNTG
jgi:hypothetical protein